MISTEMLLPFCDDEVLVKFREMVPGIVIAVSEGQTVGVALYEKRRSEIVVNKLQNLTGGWIKGIGSGFMNIFEVEQRVRLVSLPRAEGFYKDRGMACSGFKEYRSTDKTRSEALCALASQAERVKKYHTLHSKKRDDNLS